MLQKHQIAHSHNHRKHLYTPLYSLAHTDLLLCTSASAIGVVVITKYLTL